MVVGGGGREHAIIKKIKENPNVTELYALPGNGGIAADADCVSIGAKDIQLEGKVETKTLVKFNIVQLVSHVICWGAVAPVLDILIYSEPIDKLFAQGLFAGISNAVTTAIVGTLLCIAYAATKTKAGSLTKE